MVTAYASVASAVEAMRHGAFDYIEKPFDADAWSGLVARAIGHGRLMDAGRSAAGRRPAKRAGHDRRQPADAGAARADRPAWPPTRETVLITGESGTGKELVARAVHAASRARPTPLVSLNCPVLSAQLMESELFGHERARSPAPTTPRTGRFELADGGTILLDEITEIDLPLQAKLLRVLQEQTFERVGSSRTIERRRARAGHHQPRSARRGRRRPVPRRPVLIAWPWCRWTCRRCASAREDIPRAGRPLSHAQPPSGCKPSRAELDAGAIDLLVDYHWPGNVRELENIITRASVLNRGSPIDGRRTAALADRRREGPSRRRRTPKRCPSA